MSAILSEPADPTLSRAQPAAGGRDWRLAPPGALIDHLLERFHETHRRQLPELIRIAKKVEARHADHPACPHGLAAHLEVMQRDLESHLQKEEQILFPLLRNGSPAYVPGPIAVMRHEHAQHDVALARLAQLSRGGLAPEAACSTWQALYAGLAVLRDDLLEHMRLENDVLFAGVNHAVAGGCGGGCCGGCG